LRIKSSDIYPILKQIGNKNGYYETLPFELVMQKQLSKHVCIDPNEFNPPIAKWKQMKRFEKTEKKYQYSLKCNKTANKLKLRYLDFFKVKELNDVSNPVKVECYEIDSIWVAPNPSAKNTVQEVHHRYTNQKVPRRWELRIKYEDISDPDLYIE
jgi:hypothetical protein